jgi:hypothetical protein
LQEISKQTVEHFTIKENIPKEIKVKGDNRKARYGTCVYFAGIRTESKFVNADKGEQYLTE